MRFKKMPIVITTFAYPSHKQNEIVKRYLQVRKKYPLDESLGENVASPVKVTTDGIRVLNIIIVKEGKLEEVLKNRQKDNQQYMDIEGFEFSFEVWSTFEEALGIVGLEIPE